MFDIMVTITAVTIVGLVWGILVWLSEDENRVRTTRTRNIDRGSQLLAFTIVGVGLAIFLHYNPEYWGGDFVSMTLTIVIVGPVGVILFWLRDELGLK